MNKKVQDFVAFDIETTGLNPVKDKIIEIGAVKIKKGRIIDSFSCFCSPGVFLPERIIELTGITPLMLAGAREEEEAVEDFLEFAGDEILLGHNILFDYSFIKTVQARQKKKFERDGIDTLAIAKRVLPNLPSRSLEALCRYYELVPECSHRALEDAKSAYYIYTKMFDSFAEVQEDAFQARGLRYKVKKNEPITIAQKNYLNDLIKYHKIYNTRSINEMTKSEASKEIDRIILQYGRR